MLHVTLETALHGAPQDAQSESDAGATGNRGVRRGLESEFGKVSMRVDKGQVGAGERPGVPWRGPNSWKFRGGRRKRVRGRGRQRGGGPQPERRRASLKGRRSESVA